MFSTYKEEDVNILLKDISGLVQPLPTREREALIQSGRHYSEMLPLEYEPSPDYLDAFFKALAMYSPLTAQAVAVLATKIWAKKGPGLVLVSLARAGTPIGILLKRYIAEHMQQSVSHYTISIIRGRGIDENALRYILARHQPQQIQFVDGWTGKGAIQRELEAAVSGWPGVNPGLAVLSDPAGIAAEYGTRDDFLIASSCLNSTVSGLLSRTFYRDDIIDAADFHGAAFYADLLAQDLTYKFIDTVAAHFPDETPAVDLTCPETAPELNAMAEVQNICRDFNIADINFVKPGIGEATRVLLRRVPWKVLVHSLQDEEHLGHLYQLAQEKGVDLQVYPLQNYRACGIIKNLADT